MARGHIKSRSKGSWSIVIAAGTGPNGRPRQRWVTIHGNKKDAQRELTRLLTSQDQGAYVEPSKITTVEYLQRWLRDYAAKACSPKTCERWEGMIRLNIAPTIGHIPLSKLTALDIEGMHTELAKRLAPMTVRHVHRALVQALKQACRWRLLARNPIDDVVAPRVPKRIGMKVLDGAQMAALIEQSKGDRLHIPIMLAITTGMRRGEILALTWSDIDVDSGTVSVTKSLERPWRAVCA
jgi:integrase